jgi:uncharacterized protein YifE (UPF0438 family)
MTSGLPMPPLAMSGKTDPVDSASTVLRTQPAPEQYWLRQRIPADIAVGVSCIRSISEIRRIGAWLGALEVGHIVPSTALQNQFVAVCAGYQKATTRIERDWETYMMRRYSDRQRVCVCSKPEEKSSQYGTGWNFRAECICVRCGWTLPRRTGRPTGRRWRRIATEALIAAPWFTVLSLEYERRHSSLVLGECESIQANRKECCGD